MSRHNAVAELGDQLPAGAVLVDPDRLASYRNDRAEGAPAGTPLAVVFPRSTQEVSKILSICHRERVPVVPRGAGSGLAGGANAIDGAIVLCLEKMAQIIQISEADATAYVEPGVLNEELRTAVRAHGLWYAPDPASREFCSIGGNVATNAGGLCCVKYGTTRENVLGLEVVLADGRVMRVGRRSLKGVAGYDLMNLLIGSEGTLGVVTGIRTRLRPLPPQAMTVVGVFADVVAAGRAVQEILGVTTPSLLELLDSTTVAAVEDLYAMGLDRTATLLIAQSDLPAPAAAAEVAAMGEMFERAGAHEVYVAEDAEQADALLAARRNAIFALEAQGRWLLDDIAVPRSALAEAIQRIESVAARHDVTIATFGHAGDGNLHPTIVFPHNDAEAEARAHAAFHDVIDVALAVGGTVTGEHGVGLLKARALGLELDPAAVSLHAAIKHAFDPVGILNPGKALPLS